MSEIQPLLVTPRPCTGESLNGFILRTSELNGYETPTVMMHSVGMTNGEMNANIPRFEKLIPLYGRPASEFEVMGYKRNWNNRFQKRAPILHFDLPSIYVTGKVINICPECILDNGYIDAFFDLQHAIACPVHARTPISDCPSCGNPLKRYRQGLLKCSCGFDLSEARGAEVEHLPTLGLLSILRNKLLGIPLDLDLVKTRLGFPVDHLADMSLTTLIGIIGRMQGRIPDSHFCDEPQHKNVTVAQSLERAANALAYWPEGFNDYLRSLDSEDGSKKGFGLRKQFESFFGSFFKSGLPANEVAFIKVAFIQFGSANWKQAYVTKRLAKDTGVGETIVGVYGMAAALGVMPSTVRNMVKKGMIHGNAVDVNGLTRHFFDLTHGLPFQKVKGPSLTVRQAAAWIGLPVSVLKILRAKGVYAVRRIANPTSSYCEKDLAAFKKKLLASSENQLTLPTKDHVSLRQIMLMKTGSNEIKASVVSDVLSGKLISVGKSGDCVGELVFVRSDVYSLIEERKKNHFGTVTVVMASRTLHCDPVVVKNLYRDGFLKGDKKPGGIYICKDSLSGFAEQYVTCASIASERRLSSSKLVKLCEERVIELHWFSRGVGQNPQPFLKRHDALLLKAALY